MKSLVWILLVTLVHVVRSQEEIHAERYGTVEVEVKDITLEAFLPMEETFRDVLSWHISRYCKQGEDNCWADDKQIRRFDVVIQSSQTAKDNVHVEFYIRDRYDHTRAGLENHQVRQAFGRYGDDIGDDFDYDMEFISPGEQGMEPWLIAVIVLSCVVGLALIITIIVLGCKQCKMNDEKADRSKLIEEELRKDYSLSHADDFGPVIQVDPKVNPGYDSDSSSSSSSAAAEKTTPPPLYNGSKSGHYDLVIPDVRASVSGVEENIRI